MVQMTDLSSNDEWAADCMYWRGRVLTGKRSHWCFDWDGLPVDETTPEISLCGCTFDEQKGQGEIPDEDS